MTTFTVSEVREALDRGEMFLEYLPTIALQQGDRCVGGEALVRWKRNGEVIAPMQFVPLIEGTPVSGLLTYWVIDTVAAELGDWLHTHPDTHIGINIPPEVLGRGALEYVGRKSHLFNVRKQIVLEITERGVPDPMGLQELRDVSALRVPIAFDDVGIGDFNLLVLSRAPVDIIKLDKQFTDRIGSAASEAALKGLDSMIANCKQQVVAEGVEHIAQADALRAHGVQMAQGWLYSPALPARQFIEWHAAHAHGAPGRQ